MLARHYLAKGLILAVKLLRLDTFLFSADLPSLSPQLHAALKMVEHWTQTFLDKLDSFQGPPPDFISQFPVSQDGFPRGGRALMRYKALMDPQNTPFRYSPVISLCGRYASLLKRSCGMYRLW